MHPTNGSSRGSIGRLSSTSSCSQSPPTDTSTNEPFVVMEDDDADDGALIALEGNRRLATLRLLREPALAR